MYFWYQILYRCSILAKLAIRKPELTIGYQSNSQTLRIWNPSKALTIGQTLNCKTILFILWDSCVIQRMATSQKYLKKNRKYSKLWKWKVQHCNKFLWGGQPISLETKTLRACADWNKTIGDGGITVDFSIIKVHTSNWPSNSWGSSNTWGSSNISCWDHRIVGDHRIPLDL